tara:strand:+ start:5556 stop:6761 length:1206 start_codon:yes stop_codon:yes gene_type:complete
MKNIWLICKYASSDKYSFNTRHFELSKEWVKNGYDVTIFSSHKSHLIKSNYPLFSGPYLFEKVDGIKTFWLKVINYKYAFSLKRIISWIQFEYKLLILNKKKLSKPNVIIVSSLSLFSILTGVFFSKRYKAKLILEIRDIWPQSLIELQKFSKNNPIIMLLRSIEKYGYRKSDLVVGTMPNLREHLKSSLIKPPPNITIPQGLKKDYTKNFMNLSKKYVNENIPTNKFIFAYTGSINKNNPIDCFLEIASEISHLNIHFLILGSGDRKSDLLKKYSHCQNISFPPYLDKKYVVDFLSYSSVCIDSLLPGIGRYGISRNKWIDYMVASKPIICFYEGYKSILNEANCGEFVKYGDIKALKKIILKYSIMSDSELKKIGNRGKDFLLENRTFDKLALNYQSHF